MFSDKKDSKNITNEANKEKAMTCAMPLSNSIKI